MTATTDLACGARSFPRLGETRHFSECLNVPSYSITKRNCPFIEVEPRIRFLAFNLSNHLEHEFRLGQTAQFLEAGNDRATVQSAHQFIEIFGLAWRYRRRLLEDERDLWLAD